VRPLTWDEAAELADLGHEIGSHTRSHPELTRLSDAALADELSGSRAELERRLDRPVVHFSAPYWDVARFSPAVAVAARAAGYASCASALRGVNRAGADPFALRRDHLMAHWPIPDVRYFLERP
jgi:peptidoglycan/xylan/chitin deacetylase (PgdA/CDA1 family)